MESIVESVSFIGNEKDDVRYDIMGPNCPNDYWCSCNGFNTCSVDY